MEKKLLSAKHKTRRHSTHKKTSHRKRTYHRRKRGMLSEVFNQAQATKSAQDVLFGALGGAIGYGLVKAMGNTNYSPIVKGLILAGSSFLMGSVVKAPIIASGMAGAGALTLMAGGKTIGGFTPVSEPAYLSEIDLNQLPAVLDEGYLDADYLSAGYLGAPYV